MFLINSPRSSIRCHCFAPHGHTGLRLFSQSLLPLAAPPPPKPGEETPERSNTCGEGRSAAWLSGAEPGVEGHLPTALPADSPRTLSDQAPGERRPGTVQPRLPGVRGADASGDPREGRGARGCGSRCRVGRSARRGPRAAAERRRLRSGPDVGPEPAGAARLRASVASAWQARKQRPDCPPGPRGLTRLLFATGSDS